MTGVEEKVMKGKKGAKGKKGGHGMTRKRSSSAESLDRDFQDVFRDPEQPDGEAQENESQNRC